MLQAHKNDRGYSLLELLIVLVIATILGVAGVSMIGNRSGSSVRAILDELEGVLMSDQKLAVATGQDVVVASAGNWEFSGTPLILARGTGIITADTVVLNGATAPESFKVGVINSNVGVPLGLSREHQLAGIVATTGTGSTWWADASAANPTNGKVNDDITTGTPFNNSSTGFKGVVVNANNLFAGGSTATSILRISGLNGRFSAPFYVMVVSTRTGAAVAGGPMGLLVGLGNGGTIYKFYNSGTITGDGRWRRI